MALENLLVDLKTTYCAESKEKGMGTAPKANPIIKEKHWVGRVGGAVCRK